MIVRWVWDFVAYLGVIWLFIEFFGAFDYSITSQITDWNQGRGAVIAVVVASLLAMILPVPSKIAQITYQTFVHPERNEVDAFFEGAEGCLAKLIGFTDTRVSTRNISYSSGRKPKKRQVDKRHSSDITSSTSTAVKGHRVSISISGMNVTVLLRASDVQLTRRNWSITGVDATHDIEIPMGTSIHLRITGMENRVIVSQKLKENLYVQEAGMENKVIIRDI